MTKEEILNNLRAVSENNTRYDPDWWKVAITAMQQYADQEVSIYADKGEKLREALEELIKWCEPNDKWNYMAALERASAVLSHHAGSPNEVK